MGNPVKTETGSRHPMLVFFGTTDEILNYAKTYVEITMWGIPFLLISTGGNQLIRSAYQPAVFRNAVSPGDGTDRITLTGTALT